MAAIPHCPRWFSCAVLTLAIMLGAMLVVLDATGAARADWRQSAPWCAYLGGGWGFDCSYHSLRQCLATARGLGGYCSPNPRVAFGDERGRRQRWDRW